MLVLYETPAGYALFNLKKEEKLKDVEELARTLEDPASASKLLKLHAFHKFASTSDALDAATNLLEGKMNNDLKSFLRKHVEDGAKLAVADKTLGTAIAKKIKVDVVSDQSVQELYRGIRGQLMTLIEGLSESDMSAMSLGLSHSLSRHKLKLNAEKVDTMIIQAVSLLDDLDKELNTYSMRLKEWYGWHFPELTKMVVDNLAYARTVRLLQFRTNAATVALEQILPESLAQEVRAAADISMGTEISEEDMLNIDSLAKQVVDMSEYRSELYEYLKNRMNAMAPNLTAMVGELVGARLISHAGSLINLAKHPSSTVQILGAEKALFRALKTKHDTPKYGLIYHASLVGQAGPKLKGKISRVLAAKTSLAARVDALTERDEGQDAVADIGVSNRIKVEERLRQLEAVGQSRLSGSSKAPRQDKKYDFSKSKTYNPNDDFDMTSKKDSDKNSDKKDDKKEKKEKKDSDKKDKKEEKKEKEADKKDESSKKEKKSDKKAEKEADKKDSKKDKRKSEESDGEKKSKKSKH